MHTKNLLVLFALTTSIFSAPIPSPRFSSLGSAFGNLNWNGAGNSVGNGNKGNGNDNGNGSGSNNGNGNVFGNGNAIGSGNSGIDVLKRGSGSNILGSAFGNLNSNGGGNAAGNGNAHNGNGNGVGSGSYNGNGNTFDNGNAIGSDNSGISILNRRSGSNIVGSALSNLNGNGNDNSAGNKNWGNGNGNGDNSGSSDGNGNIFGNKNSIGSGNSGFSILNKVRRQSDAADIIPDQTVTGFTKVITEAFNSFLPTALPDIIKGALTGTESDFGKGQVEKRQLVLTGLGDVIAQDVAAFIP
ncbi:hypothetical protein BCIN_05g01460 [Botrytis cinerea B05.10]|uniref:Uncharacterized protein n=1 Tax=Botryotinia fuckeliana (strain B05.10) TaxID=332648 RepID=A0A384JGK0_BOTFB|nr:hypothetical protein BCIN_05g01460 [Botrytis cinerea B05.10]ATZ49733.1 hypothetical protein BCIN_05g01460 [Botrytis cinerea B05.10]